MDFKCDSKINGCLSISQEREMIRPPVGPFLMEGRYKGLEVGKDWRLEGGIGRHPPREDGAQTQPWAQGAGGQSSVPHSHTPLLLTLLRQALMPGPPRPTPVPGSDCHPPVTLPLPLLGLCSSGLSGLSLTPPSAQFSPPSCCHPAVSSGPCCLPLPFWTLSSAPAFS